MTDDVDPEFAALLEESSPGTPAARAIRALTPDDTVWTVEDAGIGYYDRQGTRIGLMTFGRLFEDLDYRIIAKTDIAGFQVSTIWLGLDHSFDFSTVPLLFETMVFTDEFTYSEMFGRWFREAADFQERYETEGEAWAGHWIVCLLLRSALRMRGLPGQRKMIERG